MLRVFWSVTIGTATLPLMAQPAASSSGESDLGRYEILFRLAAGGMAEVFVARQRGEGGFERPVAIKRMLAHLAEDERFVAMFLDEAKLAACIGSPHVVQTLDVGLDDAGAPFIVMDLVIGLTLAQSLRAASAQKTQIPVQVACEILAQAAEGLHDAHEAVTPTGMPLEIVHRDVSPQNVLIGVDGRARISDFGVARALARLTKTSTGEFKGKLSYFSPEQAEGKELDRRSDVFSLGIVAWETFVGARLFKSDNPLSVLDAIRNQQIPLVSELRQGIPDGVAAVVAHALERDVSKRTQSASDFARALRRAAEDAGLSADTRMVGTFIKEISGTVLEQMSKRISEAFAQRQANEDTGRVSLVGANRSNVSGVGGRAKQALHDDSFRIDVAIDEKIAKGPDSEMPQTAVVKKLGDSGVSNVSSHSAVTDPDRTRVSPEIAVLERRQKMTMALIVGAIVAAGAGFGIYMATKSGAPPETPTVATPSAPAAPAGNNVQWETVPSTPTPVQANVPAQPAQEDVAAAQPGGTPTVAGQATAGTSTTGSRNSGRHSGSSTTAAAGAGTAHTPAIMLNPEQEEHHTPATAQAPANPPATTQTPATAPANTTQTPATAPATGPRRGPLLGAGSFDEFNNGQQH